MTIAAIPIIRAGYISVETLFFYLFTVIFTVKIIYFTVPNLEVICDHAYPKGLLILNDFITPEEEKLFLNLFDFEESSNLKNRQVKHYGYEFRYGSNDVDLASPLEARIPEECGVLWQRLKAQGLDVGVPDQLTVNKYKPGQGKTLVSTSRAFFFHFCYL